MALLNSLSYSACPLFEAGVEGKYSVHPFRIAPYLTDPHAIAYWSALHHYGYTEQIPGTTFVATTTRRASTTLQIDELGFTYRFVVLAKEKFFGLRSIWIEGQEITITNPAKTVIDCLDHPEYCGGIIEAAKGLHNALTEGDIPPNQLTGYADRMENRTIFKRMGYLAELMALPVGEELERACRWMHQETSIEMTPVVFRTLRDVPGEEAYQAHIAYIGPLGRLGGTPPRIHLDLTIYETLVLTPEDKPIFHPYSDADQPDQTAIVYALDEMLAEKLRVRWPQHHPLSPSARRRARNAVSLDINRLSQRVFCF